MTARVYPFRFEADRLLRCALSRLSVALVLAALASSAVADNSGRFVGLQLSRVPAEMVTAGVPGARLLEKSHQLSLGFHRFGESQHWLELGAEYQYTRYEYDGLESRNRDLHRLALPVRWQLQHEQWRYSATIAPGVATSSNVFKDPFERIARDDLFVAARAEARRLFAGRDVYFGAAYDRLTGQPALYPLAGIEYRPGRAWRVRLGFPDPELAYQASDRHAVTVRLYPAGSQWHVVSDDFQSDFLYRTRALRSRLTWSVSVFSRVVVDLYAGMEFDRQHRLVDARGVDVRLEVDSEWLIGIALRSRRAPLTYVHEY